MKKILLSVAMCCLCFAAQAANWGETPALHVEGNHLVNADGEQVMLHGIMDTPSPYFCGYRFSDGHYIDVYSQGDQYITKCINYFDKLFTAVTDTEQGSWCNAFRLHLDPCWTNDSSIPSTGTETGEANISQFSATRLNKYLNLLYSKIALKANNHGMYVIMRPPGVCPHTIKVGDEYQQYLLKVWDLVSKNNYVKNYQGWLSFELANEPVQVLDANGQQSDHALYDFFQPIVEKIRANGFKGILWIPGATWQQNYTSYAVNPIKDTMTDEDGNPVSNIGYAVHFYPGWFSTSDNLHDANTSIRAFLDMVPVVKDYPIVITEVDWSPENPNGQSHTNEYGEVVKPNYGTWATGSTSKFGEAYKAVVDYFGNISMTLSSTGVYLDIDHYLNTGVVRPAFTEAMNNDPSEACSAACFQWYKEYAASTHKAREWDAASEENEMFPLRVATDDPVARVINPNIYGTGSFKEATGQLITGQYGFGGWTYTTPLNLSEYKYIVVELKQTAAAKGDYSASFRLFDNNSYWSEPYSTNLGGKKSVAIPLQGQKKGNGTAFDPSKVYIAGFWTLGGSDNAVYISKVFVSNDGISPAAVEDIYSADAKPAKVVETLMLNGMKAKEGTHGIVIERLSDGTVRKAVR